MPLNVPPEGVAVHDVAEQWPTVPIGAPDLCLRQQESVADWITGRVNAERKLTLMSDDHSIVSSNRPDFITRPDGGFDVVFGGE